MSFGIAGRIGFDQSPSDIVHNADAALYYAKLKGRNGTYVYSEEGFISHLEETARPFVPALDPIDVSIAGIRRIDASPFKPSPLRKVPEVSHTQQEQSQPEVEPEFNAKPYRILGG